MRRTRSAGFPALSLLLALGGFVLGATDAEAQARGFTLGLSTGAVFPAGDLSDLYETGLHLDGFVESASPAGLPFGLRGELGYLRFSEGSFSTRFLSGRVNAVLPFATAPDARPYLLVGGGLYNVKGEFSDVLLTVSDGDTENRFGVNVGVGIDYTLGGIATFVEARLHNVFRDHTFRFVPLTLGIRF